MYVALISYQHPSSIMQARPSKSRVAAARMLPNTRSLTTLVLLAVCFMAIVQMIFRQPPPPSAPRTVVSNHEDSANGNADYPFPVRVAPAKHPYQPNARLCHANNNPYLKSLTEPASIVSHRMIDWLDNNRTIAGAEALMNPKYRTHSHHRFFPLVPLATCQEDHLKCIPGRCGKDVSKMVCGLEEHVAVKEGEEASSKASSSSSSSSSCVIYSIGGQNKWAFEESLLRRTPCEIHTFDCTGPRERFRVPDNPRLHFHHVCLTPYSQNSKNGNGNSHPPDGEMVGASWTLLEMQQKLGHSRIDLLKMDIEGWEWPLFSSWPTLDQVVESREILLPMQIVVEIHYRTQFPNLHGDKDDWKSAADIVELQARLLRMGYAVVNRDDNSHCKHCTELTLMRIHCPEWGVYANGNNND